MSKDQLRQRGRSLLWELNRIDEITEVDPRRPGESSPDELSKDRAGSAPPDAPAPEPRPWVSVKAKRGGRGDR